MKNIKLAIVVVIILASSLFTIANYQGETELNSIETDQYTMISKVVIDGNTNFTDTATLLSWPGVGNSTHPIIIENIEMQGTPADTLFSISNTDLFFEIRNSYFNGSEIAIYLAKTINAKVTDNLITHNFYGIFDVSSTGNIFMNNLIFNNTNGIISGSDYLTISGNTFTDNYFGLNLDHSSWNTIADNVFSNQDTSIYLDRVSQPNNISNNILSNSRYGIFSHGSIDFTVMNNEIKGNIYGIYTSSTSFIIIKNNHIYSNDIGVFLTSGSNNTVTQNNVHDNNDGIHIDRQSTTGLPTNVTKNTVYDNDGSGIIVSFGRNARVADNMIFENGRGIAMNFGSVNNAYDNNIYDNNYGIYLSSVEYPNLMNNTLTNNGFFMTQYVRSLIYHDINTLEGNLVNGKPVAYYNHSSDFSIIGDYGQIILVNVTDVIIDSYQTTGASVGVLLSHSSNIVISNGNFINNTQGIGIYDSENISIADNTIMGGVEKGIQIDTSTNVNIDGNDIFLNRNGIVEIDSEDLTINDNKIHDNLDNGISLDGTVNAVISKNVIYKNGFNTTGVQISPNKVGLDSSTFPDFLFNQGILLFFQINTQIFLNTIAENAGLGMYFQGTGSIFQNDFLVNNVDRTGVNPESAAQVLVIGNPLFGENYFSDATKTETDSDGDGLLDSSGGSVVDFSETPIEVPAYSYPLSNHHILTDPIVQVFIDYGDPKGSSITIHFGGSEDSDGDFISYTIQVVGDTYIASEDDLEAGFLTVPIGSVSKSLLAVFVTAECSGGLSATAIKAVFLDTGAIRGPPSPRTTIVTDSPTEVSTTANLSTDTTTTTVDQVLFPFYLIPALYLLSFMIKRKNKNRN